MSDTDDMLILALMQMKLIDRNSQTKSLKSLSAEDFQTITLQLLHQVQHIKNIRHSLPDQISKSGSKYQECQTMVDFLKAVDFQGALSLSDLVTPSLRSKQMVLEFLLEITNVADNEVEFSAKETENQMKKKKIKSFLKNWLNEPYILPELREEQKKEREVLIFVTNEALTKRKLNKLVVELSDEKVLTNTFLQKVTKPKIMPDFHAKLAERQLILNKAKNNYYIPSKFVSLPSKVTEVTEVKEVTENSNKIQDIFEAAENEKDKIKKELQEQQVKLSDLTTELANVSAILGSKETEKLEMEDLLRDINGKNERLDNILNEKILVFETLVREKDKDKEEKSAVLQDEVKELADKFKSMTNDWLQYSGEMKNNIELMRTKISTKKKEYNFKYEKIGELKEEVSRIENKINEKRNLKEFLKEEYDKIQIDINRNTIISKINDLTKAIVESKDAVRKQLANLAEIESEIDDEVRNIKRVENEIEEAIFKDANSYGQLKAVNHEFIQVRESYNTIQKKIFDMHNNLINNKSLKTEVDNFKQKLKEINIVELKEEY